MLGTARSIAQATLVSSMISFVLIACGGTSAKGVNESDEPGGDPGTAGAADEQALQAQKKCESEIEKARLQPPDTLAKVQVHACLIGVRPQWIKCGKGVAREVTIKIIVEKTGAISSAFPVGDGADCPEAKCVADAIAGVKFPQFKATTQSTLKYPFKLGE